MITKKEKKQILHLLGLAECRLLELLPSNIPKHVSNDAFSVITYFDHIRLIIDPSLNEICTSTDKDGNITYIGID